jgi:hypothetical protein
MAAYREGMEPVGRFGTGSAGHAEPPNPRTLEPSNVSRAAALRRLRLATLCLPLITGCGGIPPGASPPQESRRLEAEYDQAWEATIRTLVERGFDIRRMDRPSGTIETGWLFINPDYSATVFVTQQEDRYSLCGKPGLGQAFRGKEARLELVLRSVRRGETAIHIAAFFRTHRYSDSPLRANRPLGDVACNSRGRLEEEVQVQVQLRAISARLERLRRGGPQ